MGVAPLLLYHPNNCGRGLETTLDQSSSVRAEWWAQNTGSGTRGVRAPSHTQQQQLGKHNVQPVAATDAL